MINHHGNKGFTLVELMISMMLGLFMLAAVMQMFLSSNKSYLLAEGLSRTQESGRSGLHFLTQSIRMAGFASQSIKPDLIINDCADKLQDVCSKNSDETSDRLAIQLESPADDYVDCAGGTHNRAVLFANVFWLDGDDLVCRAWDSNAQKWFSNKQALVSGIDSFQVQYGINEEIDINNLNVSQHVGAVPAGAGSILNIKVALLSVSGEGNLLESKEREYIVLDADPVTYNDASIRQIYSTTVSIPNNPFAIK